MKEKYLQNKAKTINFAITLLCKDLKKKLIDDKEIKKELEISVIDDIANLLIDFIEVFIERLTKEEKLDEKSIKDSKKIFKDKLYLLIHIHTGMTKKDIEMSKKDYSDFLMDIITNIK